MNPEYIFLLPDLRKTNYRNKTKIWNMYLYQGYMDKEHRNHNCFCTRTMICSLSSSNGIIAHVIKVLLKLNFFSFHLQSSYPLQLLDISNPKHPQCIYFMLPPHCVYYFLFPQCVSTFSHSFHMPGPLKPLDL